MAATWGVQEVLAVVVLVLGVLGFGYSVFRPVPLLRLTAWSNGLIGWRWPRPQDEGVIRGLAALGLTAFLAGLLSFLRGYR